MTSQHDFPTAGVELRHLLVVSNYARSLAFYRDVLGATVVREFPGTLTFHRICSTFFKLGRCMWRNKMEWCSRLRERLHGER